MSDTQHIEALVADAKRLATKVAQGKPRFNSLLSAIDRLASISRQQQAETAVVAAAEKLVRCKGRYHTEQNFKALAALFGITVPDTAQQQAEPAREAVAYQWRSFIGNPELIEQFWTEWSDCSKEQYEHALVTLDMEGRALAVIEPVTEAAQLAHAVKEPLGEATISWGLDCHLEDSSDEEAAAFMLGVRFAEWQHGVTKQAAPAAAPAAEPMSREVRMAIMLAYGHLWHVNNEPAAPIPLYAPEKAAYEARKQLRDLLTTQERGEAINQVGALIGRYDAAPAAEPATTEQLIEFADALQKRRALHIAGSVRALRLPGPMPLPFDAGYDLACQEILHRLEHEQWELTENGYAPVGGHPEAAPAAEPYTYASRQATNCAGCGEYKHTPLRVDAMDGYVCLTCIDKKLCGLLGEFGYESEAPAATAPQAEYVSDEASKGKYAAECLPPLDATALQAGADERDAIVIAFIGAIGNGMALSVSDRNKALQAADYLRERLAAAPQPERQEVRQTCDFVAALKDAEAIVRSKAVWKRFIDGTPLANDIPVWMANFACEKCEVAIKE